LGPNGSPLGNPEAFGAKNSGVGVTVEYGVRTCSLDKAEEYYLRDEIRRQVGRNKNAVKMLRSMHSNKRTAEGKELMNTNQTVEHSTKT
jgi:hypothetical protein